jgi:hypothetical protein
MLENIALVAVGAVGGYWLIKTWLELRELQRERNRIKHRQAIEERVRDHQGVFQEYIHRRPGDLCEDLASHVQELRNKHEEGTVGTRDAKNFHAEYWVELNVRDKRLEEPYKFKDVMAQFPLDLTVTNAEVAALVESFKAMELDDVRTMWRAKFGDEVASVDDVMNDCVGSALFEVLAHDLKVERMYDTYKQTLYFKLKNAGS